MDAVVVETLGNSVFRNFLYDEFLKDALNDAHLVGVATDKSYSLVVYALVLATFEDVQWVSFFVDQ